MATQLPTDTEEPPRLCDQCDGPITLDMPVVKVTLHSYPTPAPDETKVCCASCADRMWRA